MANSNKPRQEIAKVFNINIIPARCDRHLKQQLNDPEVKKTLSDLSQKLKTTTDPDEMKKIKEQITVESQKNVRISSEASSIVAYICDNLLTTIIKESMDSAIASGKKCVDISSIVSTNSENNKYYSVYNKLPIFTSYDAKLYDTKPVKKVKVEGAAVEIKPKTKADKTKFSSYIDNIIKKVKSEYNIDISSKLKIDPKVKFYLSDLCIECIGKFVTLFKIISDHVLKLRTFNSNHVKVILHILMKNDSVDDSIIQQTIKDIDDKVELFQQKVKTNSKPKDDTVSESKMLDKKKKDLINAEKRITEVNDKIKKLTEEINSTEPAAVNP